MEYLYATSRLTATALTLLFSGIFVEQAYCQHTGTVRCYVCRSIAYSDIYSSAANCPDIYNTGDLTIKYCDACLKYVGIVSPYPPDRNATAKKETERVVRSCYTNDIYEGRGGTNGTSEGAPNIVPNIYSRAKFGLQQQVQGKTPRRLLYGPGEIFVCNDGDLCNSGNKQALSAFAYFIVASLAVNRSF